MHELTGSPALPLFANTGTHASAYERHHGSRMYASSAAANGPSVVMDSPAGDAESARGVEPEEDPLRDLRGEGRLAAMVMPPRTWP